MLNKTKVILPKRKHVPVLDGDYLVGVYYHPWKSFFFLHRLKMILSLMDGKFKRLLDLGCGCGIFLPSLKEKSLSLYGCDIHDGLDKIKAMLNLENTQAQLLNLDILKPDPLYTAYFDGIVCMSVLEHIQPALLPQAVVNIKNMLTDEGKLFLGIPVDNFIGRLGHVINKYDYKKGHPANHTEIINVLISEFEIIAQKSFPGILKILDIYIVLMLKKKKNEDTYGK